MKVVCSNNLSFCFYSSDLRNIWLFGTFSLGIVEYGKLTTFAPKNVCRDKKS